MSHIQRALRSCGLLAAFMLMGLTYSQAYAQVNCDSAISDKYWSLGGPSSFLGWQVTGVNPTPDGVGRWQQFQGGYIHCHPAIGAWSTRGAIREKWASLGWEQGFLGYPTSDENPTPDGVGRWNSFSGLGGYIHWHPAYGAWETHGSIRVRWAELGWERSYLGYPLSDETPAREYRYNRFVGGYIYWSPQTGAYDVHGPAYQFPFDRGLVGRYGCTLYSPHHGYPAWDCPMDEGTPITALMEGAAYNVGEGCGNGVKIIGRDGFTYTYCHGSRSFVYDGQFVQAGDVVMLSGNTGTSNGPHLHLDIRRPGDGALICPQAVLQNWYDGRPYPPNQDVTTGCYY